MSPLEIPDRKRNVVLYLDQHLVQEAKDRGINLSRFLEYDLRLFLNRMKQSNLEYANGITGETESAPAQNDPQRDGRAGWCGGWEPRTSLPVKAGPEVTLKQLIGRPAGTCCVFAAAFGLKIPHSKPTSERIDGVDLTGFEPAMTTCTIIQ
jgi:hypothetical protein